MKIQIIGPGRFGSYLQKQIELHSNEKPMLCGEDTPLETLSSADLTILCVPIRNLETCVSQILPVLKKNSILIDTCSVKIVPLEILVSQREKQNRPDIRLAGTHPLFGPQSAPKTCNGQRIALCPVPGENIPQEVTTLWEKTLKTVTIPCSAEEHDQQMATQVINHFVGRITEKMGLERVTLSTRTHELFMDIQDIVCGNSKELFEDMNRFNPMAAPIRKAFLQAAEEIDQALLPSS